MKKLLYLFLLIMIISNTGCTKKSSEVTAVTTGLSFTAEITCDNTELVCLTEISKSGKTDFTILYPEEIKDFRLSFNNEAVTAQYKGLNYNNSAELPQTAPLSIIYNILKDANKNKNNVTTKDNSFIIASSFNKMDYTLQLGATGLPIKIICHEKELEVIIKNAAIN